MSKFFTLVTLTMVVSSLAFDYEIRRQDAASKIVGIWKSLDDVNGESQAVITINKTDNKLDGKFVFRGLTVNGQENVTLEVSLTNITFDGTTLSFRVTFPGPKKMTTDWELKLRNENEAGFSLTKEEGKSVEDAPSFTMKRTKAS